MSNELPTDLYSLCDCMLTAQGYLAKLVGDRKALDEEIAETAKEARRIGRAIAAHAKEHSFSVIVFKGKLYHVDMNGELIEAISNTPAEPAG